MSNVSSSPTVSTCTFSGNSATVGGGGMRNYSSSLITVSSCTFSGNSASASSGGMSNSSSSLTVSSCIFSGNSANRAGGMSNVSSSLTVSSCTFSGNIASVNGGGMYNWSSSPKVYNSIFWDNKKGSTPSATVAGADIYNVNSSSVTISNSLLQLEATSYTSANENELQVASTGNVFHEDPLFVDINNPAGADGIHRTADDGLQLRCGSPAINTGDNNPSGVTMPSTDITGATRIQGGTVDMGAYEKTAVSPVSTISATKLPVGEGLYNSTYTILDGMMKHYCDCDNNLLLSLSTNGNVPDDKVSLKIGADKVTYYSGTNTGFITNTDGGVLMNRSWDVSAGSPSGNVTVRCYFTADEYAALNTAIVANNSGTALTGVNQMKFYKVTKTGEHLPVADIAPNEVILLDHGTTASTTIWTSGTFNTDHYAEFQVTSFSGGGMGGASGGAALPVELMDFQAERDEKTTLLTWATASEENNKGFEVQHSLNGRDFSPIGWVDGRGTSVEVQDYQFRHDTPRSGTNYYRLKQMDYDGAYEYSEIRMVSFDSKISLIVLPNPSLVGYKNALILYTAEAGTAEVALYNTQGQLLFQQSVLVEKGNQRITLPTNDLPAGTYHLRVVSDLGIKSTVLMKN